MRSWDEFWSPGTKHTTSPSPGWPRGGQPTTWLGSGNPNAELVVLVLKDQSDQVVVRELVPGDQHALLSGARAARERLAHTTNPVQDYPGHLSSGVDKGEGRCGGRAVDRE